MQHTIQVTGHRYALRPVEIADADLILELRTNPRLSRYLHTIPLHRDAQVSWIKTYLTRSGDWYFVVENRSDSRAEGLIGLYDHDALLRRAEWGRWILRTGSLAAVETALLIYRVGFDILGLREMFCRTVAGNHKVVSFHDRTGVPRSRTIPGCFDINGDKFDAVEHQLNALAWPAIEKRLDKVAEQVAQFER